MPEQILVHPTPIASPELPIRSGAAIPPSFRDNLSLLPPVVVQLVFLPCVMVHALTESQIVESRSVFAHLIMRTTLLDWYRTVPVSYYTAWYTLSSRLIHVRTCY